jgi:CRP-like cAMP-binding protein
MTDLQQKQLLDFFLKFNSISLEVFERILQISHVLHIHKNSDLQAIGQTCKTIYFINKGCARIYYLNNTGIDITDSFILENQVIVRVESLFTGTPSRKGIQVLEDAEITAINATKLFELYDAYPEVERLFRKIFERSHIETVERVESIQFHSAEERYQMLLSSNPDIIKRIPLKYISSYLGITQVSLSRIRGQK